MSLICSGPLLQRLQKQHVSLRLHQILDVTSDSVLQHHQSHILATDVYLKTEILDFFFCSALIAFALLPTFDL